MLPPQLLRGLERSRHYGAVGDHSNVVACLNHSSFAKGDHVIGAGIRGPPKGFAIKTLVLEEEDWVVTTNGGAEQTRGIERIGREHYAQSGNVGENALAALGVIDGTSCQIAADGHTYDGGSGKSIVGPPSNER